MAEICTWAGCTRIAEVSQTTRNTGRVYARLCREHSKALDEAKRSSDRESWMKTLIKAIGFNSKGRKL